MADSIVEMRAQIGELAAMMKALMAAQMNATPTPPPVAPISPPVNQGVPEVGAVNAQAESSKTNPVIIELDNKESIDMSKIEESAEKLAKLEKKIDTLQEAKLKGIVRVPIPRKVEVPVDFKELDFSMKYKGTGCRRAHLQYYIRKMLRYTDNHHLLINLLHESLAGPVFSGFMELDVSRFEYWDELAETFIEHFNYNT